MGEPLSPKPAGISDEECPKKAKLIDKIIKDLESKEEDPNKS